MNAKKQRVYTKARGCAQTLVRAHGSHSSIQNAEGRSRTFVEKGVILFWCQRASERKQSRESKENAPVVGSAWCIAQACACASLRIQSELVLGTCAATANRPWGCAPHSCMRLHQRWCAAEKNYAGIRIVIPHLRLIN
jgi:hypothetical protein